MYCEYKIEDGKLWRKTSPDKPWEVVDVAQSDAAAAVEVLMRMHPMERETVFNLFCVHCGDANPQCTCMRDD